MLRIEGAGRGDRLRVVVQDREASDGGVSIHEPGLFARGTLIVAPSGERWRLCWERPGDHPHVLLAYTEKGAVERAARDAAEQIPGLIGRLGAGARDGSCRRTMAWFTALCLFAPLLGGLAGGAVVIATTGLDQPQKTGTPLEVLTRLLGDKIAPVANGAVGGATVGALPGEIAEAIRRAETVLQEKAARSVGTGGEARAIAAGPPGFTPLE